MVVGTLLGIFGCVILPIFSGLVLGVVLLYGYLLMKLPGVTADNVGSYSAASFVILILVSRLLGLNIKRLRGVALFVVLRDRAWGPLGKLGARVLRNREGDLVIVNLMDNKVTDAGLVHLKDLTSLHNLGLLNTQVTDAGLVHLKGLTNLRRLTLTGNEITGEGLEHLKELAKLREVTLDGPRITDAGLVHLKGLANLQTLNLIGCKNVTDSGMAHLKGCLLYTSDAADE